MESGVECRISDQGSWKIGWKLEVGRGFVGGWLYFYAHNKLYLVDYVEECESFLVV